eukprot:397805_1
MLFLLRQLSQRVNLRKLFVFYAIFSVAFAVFIAYGIRSTRGKGTAKLTACMRYATSFLGDKAYDNYAEYFSFRICQWFVPYSIVRWLFYWIVTLPPCRSIGGGFGHIAARHVIIDNILIEEITQNNAQQLVILGAGYDSRAFRFENMLKKYEIHVFEVDLTSTQSEKKSLLQSNNITIPSYLRFVGVDFAQDNIRELLKRNEYQEAKQTVFIFEGVSMYLHAKDVAKVLQLVSQFSGKNSVIVWDVMHRCLGYAFNLYNRTRRNKISPYCVENNMAGRNTKLMEILGQTKLMEYIKEPVNFAVDWDITDQESNVNHFVGDEQNYYNLLDFHRNNCLQTEKIYNQNDKHVYVEWKQLGQSSEIEMVQKLMEVTTGFATVSARKTAAFCTPQHI